MYLFEQNISNFHAQIYQKFPLKTHFYINNDSTQKLYTIKQEFYTDNLRK